MFAEGDPFPTNVFMMANPSESALRESAPDCLKFQRFALLIVDCLRQFRTPLGVVCPRPRPFRLLVASFALPLAPQVLNSRARARSSDVVSFPVSERIDVWR